MSPEAAGVAVDERLRAYVVGIQNHFKSDDVARARANLETFRQTFQGNDDTSMLDDQARRMLASLPDLRYRPIYTIDWDLAGEKRSAHRGRRLPVRR